VNETAILRELLLHLYSKNAADDPDLPPELAIHLQNLRDGKSLGLCTESPVTEPANAPANARYSSLSLVLFLRIAFETAKQYLAIRLLESE